MRIRRSFLLLAMILVTALSCAGGGSARFVHPEYNFAFTERIAIVPFENLSEDQGAGARATRFFLAELLAANAFDVVEPGEVTNALSRQGVLRTAELTQDQIIAIGKELGVQALFLGSVAEAASVRSGSSTSYTVTLIVRMVETEQGVTVWSATASKGGRGLWSALFGTAGKSKSDVTRIAVKRVLSTLLD